jgi:large subunit ribosomal protein L19
MILTIIDYIQKKNLQTYLNDFSFSNNNYKNDIKIGNKIKIGYLIFENQKEKIQIFEGILISKKNVGLSKSFTLRKIIQNIGVEKTFFYYSPKIKFLISQQSLKSCKSKMYYIRFSKLK